MISVGKGAESGHVGKPRVGKEYGSDLILIRIHPRKIPIYKKAGCDLLIT
jgi:hypothetical protein